MTDAAISRAGGVRWSPVDIGVGNLQHVGRDRALTDLRSSVAALAQSAAALEGNAATPDDARAMLSGQPVALDAHDSNQLRALLASFQLLAELVARDEFTLGKATSDRLHRTVAEHEAIESGHFRGEGVVLGGGAVRLTGGRVVEGEPPGPNGAALIRRHKQGIDDLIRINHAGERALGYYAFATRRQFYFDGNKRTARLMMNGALVSAGIAAVDLPVSRASEFHQALDVLFLTDDATRLLHFISSCATHSRR